MQKPIMLHIDVLLSIHAQNLQRLNKEINNYVSPYILGIYGMAGSRNTTLTKVFCNNMMQLFWGKVCHIKLGSKDFLEFVKTIVAFNSTNIQVNDLGKVRRYTQVVIIYYSN